MRSRGEWIAKHEGTLIYIDIYLDHWRFASTSTRRWTIFERDIFGEAVRRIYGYNANWHRYECSNPIYATVSMRFVPNLCRDMRIRTIKYWILDIYISIGATKISRLRWKRKIRGEPWLKLWTMFSYYSSIACLERLASLPCKIAVTH